MTAEQFWKLREAQGAAPPHAKTNSYWSHLEPKCAATDCGVSLRVNWGMVYCPCCQAEYTNPHEVPSPPVFEFSCTKCGQFECEHKAGSK